MPENPTRFQRYRNICLTGFGVITSAGAIATLPRPMRAATLGGTVALAVVAYAVVYIRKRNSGTGAYHFMPRRRASVRTVRTETELRLVSDLDAHYYGAHSVDYDGLRGWWRRYPRGVTILEMDGQLVGAVGIWPLTESTFNQIVAGDIDEPKINAPRISNDGPPRKYWYFGDIVMTPSFRRKQLSLLLIEGAMRLWLKRGGLAPTVRLVAYAYEEGGEKLLKRFGFFSSLRSPLNYPVYEREASIAELEAELHVHVLNPRETLRKKWWSRWLYGPSVADVEILDPEERVAAGESAAPASAPS